MDALGRCTHLSDFVEAGQTCKGEKRACARKKSRRLQLAEPNPTLCNKPKHASMEPRGIEQKEGGRPRAGASPCENVLGNYTGRVCLKGHLPSTPKPPLFSFFLNMGGSSFFDGTPVGWVLKAKQKQPVCHVGVPIPILRRPTCCMWQTPTMDATCCQSEPHQLWVHLAVFLLRGPFWR